MLVLHTPPLPAQPGLRGEIHLKIKKKRKQNYFSKLGKQRAKKEQEFKKCFLSDCREAVIIDAKLRKSKKKEPIKF